MDQPPNFRDATLATVDPTEKWTSYQSHEGWFKKTILNPCVKGMNRETALEEAQRVFGRAFSMTFRFSAGKHWLTFQLISDPQGSETEPFFVILRVRLPPPKHVAIDDSYKSAENVQFAKEADTNNFLATKLTNVRVPRIYHVCPWGSSGADNLGYPFMLMERMTGNTLQDVMQDRGIANYTELEERIQTKIKSQWVELVVDLSSMQANRIGPYVAHENTINMGGRGLYRHMSEFIATDLGARIRQLNQARQNTPGLDAMSVTTEFIGVLLFRDICLEQTVVARRNGAWEDTEFPLVHLSLAEQNILLDDNFNFTALTGLGDAATLPKEFQTSYAWDCWADRDAAEEYHTMLRMEEEKRKEQGRELTFPPSRAIDTTIRKAYMLYKKLGFQPADDPSLVMELLELMHAAKEIDPDHYLAGCVARHWSAFFGMSFEWSCRPATVRMALLAVKRAMECDQRGSKTESDLACVDQK